MINRKPIQGDLLDSIGIDQAAQNTAQAMQLKHEDDEKVPYFRSAFASIQEYLANFASASH